MPTKGTAMKSTKDWLQEVKKRHAVTSDYALSKLLDVSRQHVSNWMLGNNTLSDYAALKVADALGINPLEVIASMNAERAARIVEKQAWERLAKKLATAAMILIFSGISIAPEQSRAALPDRGVSSSVYYVK